MEGCGEEKLLEAGGAGLGVGGPEESKPPRTNEGGGRIADWVRNERPLSSEPFAQGLRNGGAGSHGFLPSLQHLQGAGRGRLTLLGNWGALSPGPCGLAGGSSAARGSPQSGPPCLPRSGPHLSHNPGSLGSLSPIPSMSHVPQQHQPQKVLSPFQIWLCPSLT